MEDFNAASTNLCLVELAESKVDLVAKFATKMSLYKKYMDSVITQVVAEESSKKGEYGRGNH